MLKFAWLPKIVNTWRPRGTRAIIWLQFYRISNNKFVSLNGNNPIGYKFCDRLGFFSKEF